MSIFKNETPFQRITLSITNRLGVKKDVAFTGRWLIDPQHAIEEENDEDGVQRRGQVAVAVTAKDKLAVYEFDEHEDTSELIVFEDFEEMKEAEIGSGAQTYPRYPSNVLAAVADVIGQPYTQELDI